MFLSPRMVSGSAARVLGADQDVGAGPFGEASAPSQSRAAQRAGVQRRRAGSPAACSARISSAMRPWRMTLPASVPA